MCRGFALLTTYARQRRKTLALLERSFESQYGHLANGLSTIIESVRMCIHRVYLAEIQYNMARAYHQLALVHLAVPLYMRCINLLEDDYIMQWSRRGASRSHLDQQLSRLFEAQFKIPSVLEWDAPQLRLCAMHNLSLIYRSRGVTQLAAPLIAQCMLWTDD